MSHASSNGAVSVPKLPPTSSRTHSLTLPYRDPDKSVPHNAVLKTARAVTGDIGRLKAFRDLFTKVMKSTEASDMVRVPFETLDPEVIARSAAERFAASSPLNHTPSSFSELDDQVRDVLLLWDDKKASPHRQDLVEAAESSNREMFDPIEGLISELANRHPHQTLAQIQDGFNYLDDIAYPSTSKKSLRSVRSLQDGYTAITRNPMALPTHKHEQITQLMLLEASGQLQETLEALASAASHIAHRHRCRKLRKQLKQLAEQTQQGARNIVAATGLLDEAITQSSHHQSHSDEDAVVLLAGPSEASVEPTLCEKLQTSPEELPVRVWEELLHSLHESATTRQGHGDSPQTAALFATISPAELISSYVRILATHLPENFYAAVRSYGIQAFTKEMYDRAKPDLYLLRQSTALGIDIYQDSIATIPAPTGPEDKQTFNEITRTLPNVEFRQVNSLHQHCRLTRRLAGIPFCALAINSALLERYRECARDNFPTHLPGILPDAIDCRPIPAIVNPVRPDPPEEK